MTIELSNLVKQFGDKTAVDIPHLAIQAGETFGLVGSNGAGKTTLLRMVLDLIRPDYGTAKINGRDVASSSEWKASTGSYLDEGFLLDYLTPDEFFDFIADVYMLPTEEVPKRLFPYQPFYSHELFGNTKKMIRELSKGNAKKIGLIAAMFVHPRLLIMDEPFANLDPGSQIRLKELVRSLNTEHGTTVIVSSHDLLHVSDICSRVAILELGKIVRDMPTSEATFKDLQQYFLAIEMAGQNSPRENPTPS